MTFHSSGGGQKYDLEVERLGMKPAFWERRLLLTTTVVARNG